MMKRQRVYVLLTMVAVLAPWVSFGGHGCTLRVDHPFLFLIRDRKTGVILFLGRLIQP